ncbi:RNA polymerase sigma factor [Aeromicrobium choanae]|uniref:RNA polymerase, sigma subunit, ECF family n=1 Tax=Aeromicrobium choanae TaxID=1736691 RepID=A0A1T4Z3K9_9ACTN|nr:sigma-70 family RNA polymerase sigma factor [Aeromicrobium choanae]SKB08151.1 RNA polymerase, sigma subunit, ECF family [Aeromicrobium choanae]
MDEARVVEQVWRQESSRLLGALLRITRSVDRAEDLAQEALAQALESWPRTGVPDNPAAWLMNTAKRRAIDQFRAGERQLRAYAEVGAGTREAYEAEFDEALAEEHVRDDVLRLMFTCCHPALTPESRTVLTLRLVAGLSTREIARAFLSSESTVASRISRAKRTLADARAPMEEPVGQERAERLDSVMSAVYLVFNEGHTATEGEDWTRPDLCREAVRLAAILASVTPSEPEAHALLALLELQSSRLASRVGPGGEPVLLADQDRSRWDADAISRGTAALDVAVRLGGDGPYVLQAAIAAEHARAASVETTDWERIAGLYARLARATGSLVVELNRAVALGRARGPEAGLAVVDDLMTAPALARYHLLPSVRGDLLEQLGRHDEAAAEFRRAAGLASNDRERALLRARAEAQGPSR